MEGFDPQSPRPKSPWYVKLLLGLLALAVAAALVFAVNALCGNPMGLPVSPAAQQTAGALRPDTPALDVYFVDVGQGDCIIVRAPGGRLLLVDAGPAGSFPAIRAVLETLDAKRLDAVVATHTHADHVGAMAEVIEAYEIGAFYLPDYPPEENESAQRMFAALETAGIEPEYVLATMTSVLDWDADTTVRVLNPFDVLYENANEAGVVLHIRCGQTAVLLAADTGALAERMMLKALPNAYFSANVLKLGHHGSYSSTTERFLLAVSPQLAVATCGRGNAFSHPHDETVALLDKHGVPLLTTAEYGTVHVVLDGVGVRVVE